MDREDLGRAVAESIGQLAALSTQEVMTAFHAGAFELARRTGQTPRTIAEIFFATAPTDELWRERLLPVVSGLAADT